jgi:hypothetical protein
MASNIRRDLTTSETRILALVQSEFGSQNTIDEVFFTDTGEAVIFVKALDGTSPVMANLTNLAGFRTDGTIASDDELIAKMAAIQLIDSMGSQKPCDHSIDELTFAYEHGYLRRRLQGRVGVCPG